MNSESNLHAASDVVLAADEVLQTRLYDALTQGRISREKALALFDLLRTWQRITQEIITATEG
jgi:hypothetical protein